MNGRWPTSSTGKLLFSCKNYEYSRARAEHYANVLFAESGHQNAVERSRWRAYPLCHRCRIGRGRAAALSAVVLSVFDNYPVPVALGEQAWSEARAELARRLQLIGLHAPKRSFDICEPWAETYFNLMPIHEKLRGRDFPTPRNYLRVTLCNIHMNSPTVWMHRRWRPHCVRLDSEVGFARRPQACLRICMCRQRR